MKFGFQTSLVFILLYYMAANLPLWGQEEFNVQDLTQTGEPRNELLGTWVGTSIHETGDTYYFELRLDSISPTLETFGTTYIETKSTDNVLYATFSFDGEIVSAYRDQLYYHVYTEKTILQQEIDTTNQYWCLTKSILGINMVKDTLIMKGTYETPNSISCGKGKIMVSKFLKPQKNATQEAYQNQFTTSDINVVTGKTLKIASGNIEIEVWDNYVVDQDTISIFCNGAWILKNHALTKTKKKLVLENLPEHSTLILHAENVGRQPPNTAMFQISDGSTVQKVILNSSENRSEALTLITN